MNAKEMTADPEAKSDTDGERTGGGDPSSLSPSGLGGGGGGYPIEGSRAASLGLSRWVQYVFVVVAAFSLWFLDKVATLIWQNFAEPPAVVITAAAAAISLGGTVALYRNERAHTMVADVVTELAKVTWPSRRETYASTIVVIVTSLIAAGIVGAFDFVWSFFTDLLYKHKV